MNANPKALAITAAALACAAALALTTAQGPQTPAGQAPPKIFGTTDNTTGTSAPASDDARVRSLARRFAVAWTRAASCGDPRSIAAALELATGELKQILMTAPPRPTAGVRCVRRPRVVSVLLTPGQGGRTRAIVERPGEAGGDAHLQLVIEPTSGGPRVAAIDY